MSLEGGREGGKGGEGRGGEGRGGEGRGGDGRGGRGEREIGGRGGREERDDCYTYYSDGPQYLYNNDVTYYVIT